LGKPDCLVLLGLMTVRGTTGLQRGAPPPAKQHLDGGEASTTITLEVVAAAKRSNRRKTKRIENLGKSMKSVNSMDLVGDPLQSAMTYTYIGRRS
jgi:hypothetical protein